MTEYEEHKRQKEIDELRVLAQNVRGNPDLAKRLGVLSETPPTPTKMWIRLNPDGTVDGLYEYLNGEWVKVQFEAPK